MQVRLYKLKTGPSSFSGRKIFTGQTVFFFRASARKTRNKNSSHEPGRYHVCQRLWLFLLPMGRPRPFQSTSRVDRVMWVTPPTTGSIEIKQGGDENITINHGCSGSDCGRRRSWPLRPPLGSPRPFQSTARVDRVMGDAAYDWLHRNRAGG